MESARFGGLAVYAAVAVLSLFIYWRPLRRWFFGRSDTHGKPGAMKRLWEAFIEALVKRIEEWGEKFAASGDTNKKKKSDRPTRPPKPDLSDLTPAERNEAMKAWKIELDDYHDRLREWKEHKEEEKKKVRGTWQWKVRVIGFVLAVGLVALTIAIWGTLESAIVLGIINGVVVAEIASFKLDDWLLATFAYTFVAGMVRRVPPQQGSSPETVRSYGLLYVIPIALFMGVALPFVLIFFWLYGQGWVANVDALIAATLAALVCGAGMIHRHVHRLAWIVTILVLFVWRMIQINPFQGASLPTVALDWNLNQFTARLNAVLWGPNGWFLFAVVAAVGLSVAFWAAFKRK